MGEGTEVSNPHPGVPKDLGGRKVLPSERRRMP
jgi:hypothetical protein